MQSDERRPLRRGEHNAAALLPVDTSIIFDEGKGTLVDINCASQQATPSVSRQRPRFATAQDLDDALLQAIEGKINRKNAWASKDASNLLEGITHTVESTLDAATSTDEYSSFTKVATVVEGCSKVWTSRVDSTYQRSNQMVRRMLRNEEAGDGGSDDDAEAGEGADSTGAGSAAAAAAERRKKAAQRRAQSVRTLAIDPSEINLDNKGRVALLRTGVNAQFRAITEKFDQGNAQGLLMHNTPFGGAGNLILDVDYAHEGMRNFSARHSRRSGNLAHVKQEEVEETIRPTSVLDEVDLGFDTSLTLPPFPPEVSVTMLGYNPFSANDVGGADANPAGMSIKRRLSSNGMKQENEGEIEYEEAGRPSLTLPSLLLLPSPHAASLKAEAVQRSAGVTEVGNGLEHPKQHSQEQYDNDNDDDWGGGFYHDGDDSCYDGGTAGGDGSNSAVNEELRERVAVEARQLVSGVSELNALDGRLFGGNRLALEAEDPTSWFPLVEPPANALLDRAAQKNSELLRLHKEHHFVHPSSQLQGTTPTQASKRVKREKTIVFDLSAELAATAAAAAGARNAVDNSSTSPCFLLGESGVDSTTLKQSSTPGKNMTPLGKELLLGKDPNAILPFTQSVTQRAKAQEAHLLMQDPPVSGKSIPSYLPYPISVPVFFQPFSTPLMQWNLLRKSAAGSTLGFNNTCSGTAHSRRASGTVWCTKGENDTSNHAEENNNGNDDGGGSDCGVGDMPVEFFHGGAEVDDDFMGAGGYDDYDGGDEDGDTEDPVRLAQAQILSSFERAELVRLSGALTTVSSVAADGVAFSIDGLADAELLALAKVLQAPQAALPSQVDVVKLRQTMWASVDELIQHNPAVQLGQNRKRGRAALEDERMEEDETRMPRFSDAVLPLLPQVSAISATGTLSPAFFFFSILFLANEHGLLLESVPGLDDLVIRGVSHPPAAEKAVEPTIARGEEGSRV